MLAHLRYLYAVLRYPDFADFASMGLGIRTRYLRARPFWERHLNLTREFQEHALRDWPGRRGKVFVLGAGTLLDVNCELLADISDELHLYDADPLTLKYWRRAFHGRVRYISHHEDVTGCLESWGRSLGDFLSARATADLAGLADYLRHLKPHPGFNADTKGGVILSLNLLSQIPLYWKDRVHALLKKYWSLETDEQGNLESELQVALEGSMRTLQQQHLRQLSECGAERCILITDRAFLYYRKESSLWQEEPSLYTDICIPGYKKYMQDNWFWHIAPQDVEQSDYGCIHDVTAMAFSGIDLPDSLDQPSAA